MRENKNRLSKKKKKLQGIYLLFFFLLVFPSLSWGITIWVISPDTSRAQFKAHLTALGKNHKSYAQSQWEYLKKKTKSFQLSKKIKQAQALYLSGSSSTDLFKAITDLAYLGDWNKEQRRIILYAFLRLAQLEKNSNRKKAFLISAGNFIMENLTSTYPEYNLFPPPFIERLNNFQNKKNSFVINWKKLFPHHEILLINGKKMTDKTKLKEGKYRITVLSSSHVPWIKTIELGDLLSKKMKSETLTSGHCDSLKIKPVWKKKNMKLLKNKNCVQSYAFAQKTFSNETYEKDKSSSKQTKNFQKNKLTNIKIKDDIFRESQNNLLLLENFDKEKKSFFNKKNLPKWIILGGTLVAIGLLVYLNGPEEKQSPKRKVFH